MKKRSLLFVAMFTFFALPAFGAVADCVAVNTTQQKILDAFRRILSDSSGTIQFSGNDAISGDIKGKKISINLFPGNPEKPGNIPFKVSGQGNFLFDSVEKKFVQDFLEKMTEIDGECGEVKIK